MLGVSSREPTLYMNWKNSLGAAYLGDGCCLFRVWSPEHEQVELALVQPQTAQLTMQPVGNGYHQIVVNEIEPGQTYFYSLDGQQFPDPASRCQPDGVHGTSQVVNPHFDWQDQNWSGISLRNYIFYELHVGTFTPEGTFDAVIPHLDALLDLGITAIEIMPVGQFPGSRNWGYDGVFPFAVQNTYGGPEGLKRLVNACHQKGLAVVLDVVYNHLGAEGNYLWQYGPYFTSRYQIAWGAAINFDGEQSDEVRHFFIENALSWVREFHMDALRLDATHAYVDLSARPFMEQLAEAVHEEAERLNRRVYLIAENDRNDYRVITPLEAVGAGMDAQWADELHHCLHTLFTGEQNGYYADFGQFNQLAKALQEGYVYSGQYAPARKRRYGTSSQPIPPYRFVVCTQNHDQVGNRMKGDRLSTLVDFEALKLAAGLVLLSPNLPLLFMGEEYAETNPFLYFISHLDPELVEAVRKGRKAEFAAFASHGEPPDPYAEETFEQSKLDHARRQTGHHQVMYQFYKALLHLRKSVPALSHLSKEHMTVQGYEEEQVLWMHRWFQDSEICLVFNFSLEPKTLSLPLPTGQWHKCFDSSAEQWQPEVGLQALFSYPDQLAVEGQVTLPPRAFALFSREEVSKHDTY